ncbi:MAG: hypothetical protein DYH18_11675 [Xanthomonadales bacterium PRO7]|nr:hypothetical protein [Xanthomonadales bacterium PRO7]
MSSLFAASAYAQVTLEAQDVGEIYQGNTGHSAILFNNTSNKSIKILLVTPAFEKDGVGEFKLPATVASKTSVNIPVTVFSGMDAGDHRHIFNIETDAPKSPRVSTLVHLFGLSVLDDAAPNVDLGTVNTNTAPPSKTVTLSSREVPNFHITRIVEMPDFVTAKIEPDGRTVSISGKSDAGWGLHDGYVKVALNSTVQPQAWIAVTADVHGDVIPSANPVEMGSFRNTKQPFLVQLKSRDGIPVKLGKVTLEGFMGTVTKGPCIGNTVGCAQISVAVAKNLASGIVRGKLLVELPAYHRALPIAIGGFYLPESAKVISLNQAMERGPKSSAEPPPLDLKSALQNSTQADSALPPTDPPGHGPLLKWQVSNENNIYGYLVYRGDAENGPFLRVNKDIVHVGADKGDGITSSYAWRDDSATAGKTYWYYIGMLNRDGSKQQLSGPQEVKAK